MVVTSRQAGALQVNPTTEPLSRKQADTTRGRIFVLYKDTGQLNGNYYIPIVYNIGVILG